MARLARKSPRNVFLAAAATCVAFTAHAQEHEYGHHGHHDDDRAAQAAVPIAYVSANFEGGAQALTPGRYDTNQLTIGTDQLSSLRVPPGWTVTVYEHGGFRGRSRVFTQDSPWLGNDFNDIASSLVVEGPARVQLQVQTQTVNVGQPTVVLYRDGNFAGAWQAMQPGRYDIGQLTIGNDQLSSLRVPPGWTVTVYDLRGFNGRARVFTQDTPWVGNDFNDIASSIIVDAPQPVAPQPQMQPQPLPRQGPDAVEIFRDGNFAGPSQQVYPGRYDTGQIAIGNDQISSLRVPPGWTVTLYEHAASQGRSRQFQTDTPWVGNDFNDITSSLLVEAPGPGHRAHSERAPEQFVPPLPAAEPEDLASTNLHVAHRVWRSDDAVLLDFFNMPEGDSFAWVTVVKVNARDDDWGTWSYTSGAVAGQFNVGQLAPGEYEARAFTSKGTRAADRLRFRVAR